MTNSEAKKQVRDFMIATLNVYKNAYRFKWNRNGRETYMSEHIYNSELFEKLSNGEQTQIFAYARALKEHFDEDKFDFGQNSCKGYAQALYDLFVKCPN